MSKLLNQLASKLTKKEGKKSSIKIGDAREIIGILSDIFYGDESGCDIMNELVSNGEKRASKSKRKRK